MLCAPGLFKCLLGTSQGRSPCWVSVTLPSLPRELGLALPLLWVPPASVPATPSWWWWWGYRDCFSLALRSLPCALMSSSKNRPKSQDQTSGHLIQWLKQRHVLGVWGVLGARAEATGLGPCATTGSTVFWTSALKPGPGPQGLSQCPQKETTLMLATRTLGRGFFRERQCPQETHRVWRALCTGGLT